MVSPLLCHVRPRFSIRQCFFSAFLVFSLSPFLAHARAAAGIEGIVTGSDHRPIPNASVRVVPDRSPALFEEDLSPIAEASGDSQGRFSLVLPESTAPLTLLASAPGMRTARFALTEEALRRPMLGLALEAGGTIRGRVTDATGKPLAGARVGPLSPSIDIAPADARRLVPMWATTDSDGRFAFDGAANDTDYHFIVCAPGMEIRDVAARAGGRDIDVRLSPGGSTIRGEVASRARKPAELAGTPVRVNGNGFDVVARADAKAAFEITGLPHGNYSVEAVLDDGRFSSVATITMPGDHERTVILELAEGYSIQGTTIDAATSTPVGGVRLRVNGRDAASGPDGSFTVGGLMMRGPVDVEVLAEGGFVTAEPGMIAEADGINDLHGVVVRVRGVSELSVLLDGFEPSTTTPAQLMLLGSVEPPRRVSVTTTPVTVRSTVQQVLHLYATAPDLASGVTSATLEPGSRDTLTLALAATARLTGRVTLAEGGGDDTTASLAGTRVELLAAPSGRPLAETVTGGDGTFDMPGLPHGALLVVATNAAGTQRRVQPVTLKPGETTHVELRMAAGRNLAGVVVNRDGDPVPGASVRWYAGASGAGDAEAGADGRFTLRNLAAEQVDLVRADADGYLPAEAGPIVLPARDIRLVLVPAPSVRVKVQAAEETLWQVHLVLTQPWGTGAYADQLVGNTTLMRNASGGETTPLQPGEDGRFFVAATGEGGAVAVSGPIEWKGAQARDTDITVRPGAGGTITARSDDPGWTGATVTATNMTLPENETGNEYTALLEGGTARFADLPPGDYLLVAMGDAGGASAVNVEVAPNADVQVRLEPAALHTLRGRVVDGGRGVAGATVTLSPQTEGGPPSQTAETAADGSFSFRDLSPFAYIIRVAAGDADRALKGQKPVTVERHQPPADVLVDLTPAPTVKLEFPPAWKITPGMSISLANLDTREVNRVAWDGDKASATLAPGSYEVWREDAVLGTATVEGSRVAYEDSGL